MTIRTERKAAASNPSGCCTLVGEEPAAERKATRSANSNSCALVGELPTAERKAAASAYNGTCALVGTTSTEPHMITVRDSKEVSGLVTRLLQCLTFTPDEWRAFLDGAKKGEFDLDESGHLPPVPARAT